MPQICNHFFSASLPIAVTFSSTPHSLHASAIASTLFTSPASTFAVTASTAITIFSSTSPMPHTPHPLPPRIISSTSRTRHASSTSFFASLVRTSAVRPVSIRCISQRRQRSNDASVLCTRLFVTFCYASKNGAILTKTHLRGALL